MRNVSVQVLPLRQDGEDTYLVLFEEKHEPRTLEAPARKAPRGRRKKGLSELERLEQELAASRDYLQSIIQDLEAANEELQSANEEILSSNEELQSTNEELETAKEELQSTNEELTTVNEELANRNYELAQTNNDLVNFLAAVSIPVIMVGNGLRIRRFTPHAAKALNLIPTDVGRPMSDLKPNINVPDLERKIQELQAMAEALKHLAEHCHGDHRPECPILEDLAGAIEVEARHTELTRFGAGGVDPVRRKKEIQ